METSERPTEEETPSEIGTCDLTDPAAVAPRAEPEPEENVLGNPDETTDAILEVEGRELHASRAVLAHYSPVFRAMFYSSFKERSAVKIPLPGKQYSAMVTFYNVLYPRKASDKCLINDGNLIELLTLADEYQADKVMATCQHYIGDQLCILFHNFYRYSVTNRHSGLPAGTTTHNAINAPFGYPAQPTSRGRTHNAFVFAQPCITGETTTGQMLTTNRRGQTISRTAMIQKLTLYLWACDRYRLPSHRQAVKALLVDLSTCHLDLALCPHYSSLPDASKADLLEELCCKLDSSRVL